MGIAVLKIADWFNKNTNRANKKFDVHLLIASGNKTIRQTLKSMFRDIGVENFLEADRGEKVLKALWDIGEKVEVFVILDYDIPGMKGIDICRELRSDRRFENVPLLLLAEETVHSNVALIAEMGANGCLVKPFVFRTLQNKFTSILRNRSNPPDYIIKIKNGEKLLHGGRQKEALKLFKQSLKKRETARGYTHCGEVFVLMKEYKRAKKAFDKAIELNPNYIKAYTMAADLQLETEGEEAALPYLKEASVISPNNPKRQLALGKALLKSGNLKEAKKAFNLAVKHDPIMTRAIGEELLQAGDSVGAEEHFRKSITVERRSVHPYNRLGIALRKQGKWSEAVEAYKEAIKINNRDDAIHFNLGRAYLESGKKNDALKAFKKALLINPRLDQAKEELAKLAT